MEEWTAAVTLIWVVQLAVNVWRSIVIALGRGMADAKNLQAA